MKANIKKAIAATSLGLVLLAGIPAAAACNKLYRGVSDCDSPITETWCCEYTGFFGTAKKHCKVWVLNEGVQFVGDNLGGCNGRPKT